MTLTTQIDDHRDGTATLTTVLLDDEDEVARKAQVFSSREPALAVVNGLRQWAKERGITLGVADV